MILKKSLIKISNISPICFQLNFGENGKQLQKTIIGSKLDAVHIILVAKFGRWVASW